VDLLTLLGTALALAMDAFAVSAAVSASLPMVTGRHVFRLAFHFGLFQFLMPIGGWLGGRLVAQKLASVDHWIAFGLLLALGVRMIWNASANEEAQPRDPTRGFSLVLLSIATSVDALAIGLSLGLLEVRIWFPAVVIGLVAGALTVVGTLVGKRVGPALGAWAGRLGGAVLIGIGARILYQHLAA
jgi:putative Mn2+ efflux pump MntP